MEKFKDFIKNVKINSGVAPEPVHFRMGQTSNSGISPEPVDFRMRSRLPLKEWWYDDLKAASSNKKPLEKNNKEWLHDNENKHLGPQTAKYQTGKDAAWHHAYALTKELAKKAKPLSKKESETVHHYAEDDSGKINRSLIKSHKNGEGVHPKIKDRVEHLDKVTRHPIGHDLHVYSGLGFDPKKHINSSGHLHLPAYTSTTHHKETANWFAGSAFERGRRERKKEHILHVHLKPSDHAAHVSAHSPSPEEHETILPRNTTLKVHPKPTVLPDGTHVWHAHVHKQEKD